MDELSSKLRASAPAPVSPAEADRYPGAENFRHRHRQRNQHWPSPGGGAGGPKATARSRQSSSGASGISLPLIRRPSQPPNAHVPSPRTRLASHVSGASLGLARIASRKLVAGEESVGALLIGAEAVIPAEYEYLANMKKDSRYAYGQFAPLHPGDRIQAPSSMGSDDQDSQVEEDFYLTHEPIGGRPTDWSKNAIYFHYHDVSGRSRRNWKHGEVLKMEAAARRAAEHKAYLEKERQIEALRHAAFLGLNLEVTEEELVRRDQAQFLTSELEHTDATITYLQYKRCGGWNLDSLKEVLKTEELLSHVERPIEEVSREATPEETPGPEDDAAGFDDQASRGTFLESADTLMSLKLEGSELPNNATSMASSPMTSSRIDCIRELLIQMPQAPEMPPEMDEPQDNMLTLWANAGASKEVPVIEVFSTSGPISVTLHPLLLLQCRRVADKLLSDVINYITNEIKPTGMLVNGSPATLEMDPLGFRANGLEDLLLVSARRTVSKWSLGPTEPRIFECEVEKETQRQHLRKGILLTQIKAAKTLPQLCHRAIIAESVSTVAEATRGRSLLGISPSQHKPPQDDSRFQIGSMSMSRASSRAPSRAASRVGSRADMNEQPALMASTMKRNIFGGSTCPPYDPSGVCREITLCLIKAAITNYDVPGILMVLQLSGRQLHACATSQAFLPGADVKYHQLTRGHKIPGAFLDTTRKGPDLPNDHGMSFYPMAATTTGALGSRTLSSLAITRLVITESSIDDAGLASLVLGLRICPYLHTLDLSKNKELTWKACYPLGELLNTSFKLSYRFPKHSVVACGHCRLSALILNNLRIGDKGMTVLMEKLDTNNCLQILSVQNGGITRNSARAISVMMTENMTMKELRLGWNQLGPVGAKFIGESLGQNSSLLRLEVSNNGLSDYGGSHFAFALQENAVLEELDLSNNTLAAGTCLVMSESLKLNKRLRIILLDNNPLTEEGVMHMFPSLNDNSTLERIGLSHSSFVDLVGDDGKKKMLFDSKKPNGPYRLDLHEPVQRQIAVELTRLHAMFGPSTWQECTLNGKPMKGGPTAKQGWPQRMPLKGILELEYNCKTAPPDHAQEMSEHQFETILMEITHPDTVDAWRLQFVQAMCKCAFFSTEQAARMLPCFEWSKDKVEAIIRLFGRITDTENMNNITAILTADEQRELFDVLGMAAYLRNENPSGHYNLNLSREVDRVVAARLLMQARKEEFWLTNKTMMNFRNVVLHGEKIEINDPLNFAFPTEGLAIFDFICYATGTVVGTVKKKKMSQRKRYRQIDQINFLRFVGACKSLIALENEIEEKKAIPGKASAGGATGTAAGKLQKLPSFKRQSSTKVLDSDVPPEMTPRSTGPQLMRRAQETVRNKLIKSKPNQALKVMKLIAEGKTLSDMLKDSQLAQSKLRSEKEASGATLTDFRTIVEKVDDQAEDLIAQAGKEELDRQKGHEKQSFKSALKKIRGINMAFPGMANMFDISMSRIDVLTVARTFGNENYLSCTQLRQLLWILDPDIPKESAARINIVQMLFTRLVDLWHFADVLRECSPAEQIQIVQRVGYLNAINTNRRDLAHLHGLCFIIHLSQEEEYRTGRAMADFVEACPKTPMPGQGAVGALFRHLRINGAPAVISEDRQFWETLCTLAANRKRPDETWDKKGTLEFQLLFPESWLRVQAAVTIQRIWRGNKGRKITQEIYAERLEAMSDPMRNVLSLLGGRQDKSSSDKGMEDSGNNKPKMLSQGGSRYTLPNLMNAKGKSSANMRSVSPQKATRAASPNVPLQARRTTQLAGNAASSMGSISRTATPDKSAVKNASSSLGSVSRTATPDKSVRINASRPSTDQSSSSK